jgi:hypothetical protein
MISGGHYCSGCSLGDNTSGLEFRLTVLFETTQGDVTIETQSDWGYSLGTKEWAGASGYIKGKDPVPLGVNEDETYDPTL